MNMKTIMYLTISICVLGLFTEWSRFENKKTTRIAKTIIALLAVYAIVQTVISCTILQSIMTLLDASVMVLIGAFFSDVFRGTDYMLEIKKRPKQPIVLLVITSLLLVGFGVYVATIMGVHHGFIFIAGLATSIILVALWLGYNIIIDLRNGITMLIKWIRK